jgi:Uma2 family endonuclease
VKHAEITPYSEQDYLSAEQRGEVRHEYVAGQVFAMAGAGKAHNLIALYIATRIRSHARGGPCRAYMADMKVRVAQQSAYYYPDVVVTCDGRDTSPESEKFYLVAPALIVEVLSPATEAIDRREKMLAYRTLESLQEYVLVDQEQRQIEVYRRTKAGWSADTLSPGDTMSLESIGLTLSLDEVYEETGIT